MSDLSTAFGLSSGGQFNGVVAPIKQASRYFLPSHLFVDSVGNTVASTGGRYYFAPYYVDRATTFAGAWTRNAGAGDNGDKIKIAAYNEAAAGGPGTLAKDFGEVTLTGAAALRLFASSWAATPGWYYLALVTDNAVTMSAMTGGTVVTAAGVVYPQPLNNLLGAQTPNFAAASHNNATIGEYVGGTYANFPEATSLTPATTLFTADGMSIIGLYT